ncbi:MAG: hypothetical protein V3S29_08545, partial [bacterium]
VRVRTLFPAGYNAPTLPLLIEASPEVPTPVLAWRWAVPSSQSRGPRAILFSWEVARERFEQVLLPSFREFNPDFILISAGFDAHRDDPLALVELTQHGFDTMAAGMKSLALECCGGKLVSVLEGGYNYQRLSECVSSHLSLLQEEPG